MASLYRKLKEYAQADYYPYHMPGHKRRLATDALQPVLDVDITEIDGFDNLHDAEEILLEIQQNTAKIFGAEESFFLINGSSAGILAAISATACKGKKLLMARGCHKSAYHGVYLSRQEVSYLYPGLQEEFGCELPVSVEDVFKRYGACDQEAESNDWEKSNDLKKPEALKVLEDVSAILIVSPTYEGLHADIAQIASLAHKNGIPLIVDAAHGAHLGFHEKWAENAVKQGADLVIQSLHKTLPAPTQTALLHINGNLVDRQKLKRFLGIYQSSSPSYPMMAAMEACVEYVSENREALFDKFYDHWQEMLGALTACRNISFLQQENSDIGKLTFKDRTGRYTGHELYDILLNRYHLQMEMCAGEYVLAMFTVGDDKEGYDRLTAALLELDAELDATRDGYPKEAHESADHEKCEKQEDLNRDICWKSVGMKTVDMLPEVELPLYAAWDEAKEYIRLEEAKGRIAGEFINLYPPGRPMLVPGEKFSRQMIDNLTLYLEQNMHVQGIRINENAYGRFFEVCVLINQQPRQDENVEK